MSARKQFSRIISGTSDEGASASFVRMCQLRFLASKFIQYFFKRTLCLICHISFVNRMALVNAITKVSIELIGIYFHCFEIFVIQSLLLSSQIIFRMLKKAVGFGMILKH
jgi:hypothetical protein